ncbi:hypothetical protein BXZ70DRAFT_911532 [Cristinia sonorae]|uniref:Uncharacterized protein n=1 Tax=Cristinia sonorae TaxID=1940300 RepID=A0A8K0XJT9_9AGAR|nr:hypothetical protein BXZ70DRAFT_911532 [Cristinia sonorae]
MYLGLGFGSVESKSPTLRHAGEGQGEGGTADVVTASDGLSAPAGGRGRCLDTVRYNTQAEGRVVACGWCWRVPSSLSITRSPLGVVLHTKGTAVGGGRRERLKKTYERASWVDKILKALCLPGCLPGGPNIGRVTLKDLQTVLHHDDIDEMCVVFSVGKYKGGEFLLPDLCMKFKYTPGDLVFFLSQVLWHMVAP